MAAPRSEFAVEAMIRRITRRAFEVLGYQVLEAANGEDALVLLAQHRSEVSAVVLDQTMPGMGGTQTLIRLRVDFPQLPVVRTSGYSAESGDPDNDPNTHFLGKPYGTPRLVEVVQKALGLS